MSKKKTFSPDPFQHDVGSVLKYYELEEEFIEGLNRIGKTEIYNKISRFPILFIPHLSAFGMCFAEEPVMICINSSALYNRDDLKNILFHELAHAINDMIYPKYQGKASHGEEWRVLMKVMFNTPDNQLINGTIKGLSDEFTHSVFTDNVNVRVQYSMDVD